MQIWERKSPLLVPEHLSLAHAGIYTLAGRWGGWGFNIMEDASHRIGLLQSNLSTPLRYEKNNFRYGPLTRVAII